MQNSGGYQSGGFNQDDGNQPMSKGKKGGNRNNFGSNPNSNQYQHSQQSQPQQFGGLQGAAGASGASDSTGNNGLNYQNWGGGL